MISERHPEAEGLPEGRPAKPILIGAIFLILAGTFLFLSNIGVLPVEHPWSFWPVAVVVIGLIKLVESKTPGDRALSVLMIFFGMLFLLVSVGVFEARLHDGSWPLSILFIALGMAGLAKAFHSKPVAATGTNFLPSGLFSAEADEINGSIVMSSWRRRVETQTFRGGQVHSYLGSIEIDLRAARISAPEWKARLQVAVVFGAIKLRVPEGWRVSIRGTSYISNVEDKTIPQGREIADLGTLIISGYAIGSSIDIEN